MDQSQNNLNIGSNQENTIGLNYYRCQQCPNGYVSQKDLENTFENSAMNPFVLLHRLDLSTLSRNNNTSSGQGQVNLDQAQNNPDMRCHQKGTRGCKKGQKKTHVCLTCGKAYLHKKQLETHEDTLCYIHRRCKRCGAMFSSIFCLRIHNKRVNCKRRIFCPKCGLYVKDQQHLKEHVMKCEAILCDVCKTTFFNLSELLIHVDNQHKKDTGYLDSMRRLGVERSNAHQSGKDKLVRPLEWNKSSNEGMEINNDQDDNTTKSKEYKCEYCNTVFVRKKNLRRHDPSTCIERRTCKICGIVYPSTGKLNTHNKTVICKEGIYCISCGKKFPTRNALKQHQTVDHASLPINEHLMTDASSVNTDEEKQKDEVPSSFNCSNCGVSFSTAKSLKRHMAFRNLLFCEFCGSELCGPRHKSQHLQKCTSPKALQCDKCTKVFATLKNLQQHMLTTTCGRTECEVCGEKFTNTHRLMLHMVETHEKKLLRHEPQQNIFVQEMTRVKTTKKEQNSGNGPGEDKSLTCNNCGTNFIDALAAFRHRPIYKSLSCSYCPMILCGKQHMYTHLHECSEGCICEKCGNAFASAHHLREHLRRSKCGEIKCEKCPAAFKTLILLSRHMAEEHSSSQPEEDITTQAPLHVGTPDFEEKEQTVGCTNNPLCCTDCGRTFANAKNREYHEAIRKSLNCPYCGVGLCGKRHKDAHVRICESPDALKCEKCGRTFDTQDDAIFHRTQSGCRRRKCEICDKHFRSKTAMYRHLNEQHTVQTINYEQAQFIPTPTHNARTKTKIVCEKCGKIFKRRPEFLVHTVVFCKKMICEYCGTTVYGKRNLIIHYSTCKERRTCNICGVTYTSKKHLRVHNRRTNCSPGNNCTTCSKAFSVSRRLLIHLNNSACTYFGCDFCEDKFQFPNELAEHVMKMHHYENITHEQLQEKAKAIMALIDENFHVASTLQICSGINGNPPKEKNYGLNAVSVRSDTVDTLDTAKMLKTDKGSASYDKGKYVCSTCGITTGSIHAIIMHFDACEWRLNWKRNTKKM